MAYQSLTGGAPVTQTANTLNTAIATAGLNILGAWLEADTSGGSDDGEYIVTIDATTAADNSTVGTPFASFHPIFGQAGGRNGAQKQFIAREDMPNTIPAYLRSRLSGAAGSSPSITYSVWLEVA